MAKKTKLETREELEALTIPALRDYAAANSINLEGRDKKAGIVDSILEAQAPADEGDEASEEEVLDDEAEDLEVHDEETDAANEAGPADPAPTPAKTKAVKDATTVTDAKGDSNLQKSAANPNERFTEPLAEKAAQRSGKALAAKAAGGKK